MNTIRKEFDLFSHRCKYILKRTKLPPTEWWKIVNHRFRGRDGSLHEFYF